MLEQKFPFCMVSASAMASLAQYLAVLYSTEDYVAASFRSTESEKTTLSPMVRPEKAPARKQWSDARNIQVAPHVSADVEEPTNVKCIRCQCTV